MLPEEFGYIMLAALLGTGLLAVVAVLVVMEERKRHGHMKRQRRTDDSPMLPGWRM